MNADRQHAEKLAPAALAVADVARLLGVAEDVVQKHVAAGAPAAADGSVNLVHYAAWLIKDVADGD